MIGDTAAAACLKTDSLRRALFAIARSSVPYLATSSFVGCADALSSLQRTFCEGVSRLHTAHYFNNNINLRVVCDHFVIVYQHFFNRISREIS